jgi:hypothetical protein
MRQDAPQLRQARAIAIFAAMTAKPNDQAEPPAPQPPLKTPAGPPGDPPKRPREIGGPKGPEPTRYGDWEVGGRCTDF